jgi:rare lipoprotein A
MPAQPATSAPRFQGCAPSVAVLSPSAAHLRTCLRHGVFALVLSGFLAGCQPLVQPVGPDMAATVNAPPPPNQATSEASVARRDEATSADVTASQVRRPTAISRSTAPRGLNEGLLLPDNEDESFGRLRADIGLFVQRGSASWYGPGFHGRRTASGERFDMNAMTAAHPSLPLGSWVLVRNLRNDRAVVLRVTDRGPFAKKRVLDVSRAAARKLDFIRQGATHVEIRKLSRAEVAALQQVDATGAEGAPLPSDGAEVVAEGRTGG